MGQYYKAIVLNTHKKSAKNSEKISAYLTSWDFNQGAKLMEFSYINNYFVRCFEELINKEHGEYAHHPIVFAGDYADEEPKPFKGERINLYQLTYDFGEKITYDWYKSRGIEPKHYRYVINESKGKFIDTERMKKKSYEYDGEVYSYQVHPLPILCCDGNGRGGGDYHNNHREIGAWARDVVVTSDIRPDENQYKEVFYDFYEKW